MIVPFGVYQLLKLVPVAEANRPNLRGLVMLSVEFGARRALVSGRGLFRSKRAVSFYFSL